MYGAIFSDIVSSPYGPSSPAPSLTFPLFSEDSDAGPASCATVVVGYSLLVAAREGTTYPQALDSVLSSLGQAEAEQAMGTPLPACSSAIGWAFDEDEDISRAVGDIAPAFGADDEDVRCAEAVAASVRSLRMGDSRFMVKRILAEDHGIRCGMQATGAAAPEAAPSQVAIDGGMEAGEATAAGMESFFSSWGFEHAVRMAVYGTASPTAAIVSGSVAEAYFSVPEELKRAASRLLPDDLGPMLEAWDGDLWDVRHMFPQVV